MCSLEFLSASVWLHARIMSLLSWCIYAIKTKKTHLTRWKNAKGAALQLFHCPVDMNEGVCSSLLMSKSSDEEGDADGVGDG